MPPLKKDLFFKLKNYNEKFFNTFYYFIETGTNHGDTSMLASTMFSQIETIEINSKYYNQNIEKYKNISNINFHLGDSAKILKNIIQTLNNNALFFLDAHGRYANGEVGDTDVPLNEEILEISNNFKHEAVIIVDDFRLFGSKKINHDWEHIEKSKLIDLINPKRIIDIYHLPSERRDDDRLIIHLNSI